MIYGESTEGVEKNEPVTDRELLEQILVELRQLNQNLTSRSASDRLNDEMDLVK